VNLKLCCSFVDAEERRLVPAEEEITYAGTVDHGRCTRFSHFLQSRRVHGGPPGSVLRSGPRRPTCCLNVGAHDQFDQTPMSRAGTATSLQRGRRFLVGTVQLLCCVAAPCSCSCAHRPVGLGGGGRRRRLCRRAEDHGARVRGRRVHWTMYAVDRALDRPHWPPGSRGRCFVPGSAATKSFTSPYHLSPQRQRRATGTRCTSSHRVQSRGGPSKASSPPPQ
jgi:hypothetical protein